MKFFLGFLFLSSLIINECNIVKISGDGNCLFKAISWCVYNTVDKHREIRLAVVKKISENWEFFKDFIIGDRSYRLPVLLSSDYVSLLSIDGEYAGHNELICIGHLFPDYLFRVYIENGNNSHDYGTGNIVRNLRFTGHLDSGHFDVINFDINTELITTPNPKKRPKTKPKYTKSKKKRKFDQKHHVNKTKPFKIAFKCALSDCIPNLTPHNIGDLSNKCCYCSALYFKSEETKGWFTLCCSKGKIKLPEHYVPDDIKKLFIDSDARGKHFRTNIRQYNNAMCFVSFGANICLPPGHGPYCFKIQGVVHHLISPLYAEQTNNSAYGQLYIFDFENANELRLKNPINCNLRTDILEILALEIQKYNPYALLYKTMHDKISEEKQKALQENRVQKDFVMRFHHEPKSDSRRYNNPTLSEVAAVFESVDGAPPSYRNITIYPKKGGLQKMDYDSIHCDPMCYVVIWPCGEPGWHIAMPTDGIRSTKIRQNVTMREYVSYKLAIRGCPPAGAFNSILNAGKLTQQLIVDYYCRIEGDRLKYIRNQQNKLRVDTYVGLADALHVRAEQEGLKAGHIVILPSSFIGSPRNMMQNYQDAMAMVRKFGKPDIFITFTCNGSWPEIINSIQSYETANNRPDVVVRVFHSKVKELLRLITKVKIFGECKTFLYTVEFQKRGLPHIHLLVNLTDECKLREISDIDKIVSAEIPDPKDKILHKLVSNHMVHGPCGHLNPNSVCMENGICKKGFPKEFVAQTKENVNGYPLYRRRENGISVQKTIKGNTLEVDNRYIVPYNSFLLTYFQAHINVEICASVHSIKYIHKYVYKGHDCANVKVSSTDQVIHHDEVTTFLNTRYVGPGEAAYRIFSYKMHDQSHTVVRLPVHLPNQQHIYFTNENAPEVLNNARSKNTMLTAWFELNKNYDSRSPHIYPDTPLYYVWDKSNFCWKKRKNTTNNVIGRMYNVAPSDSERYHLRLLLLHVIGITSFDEIKTYRGVTYSSFKEVAVQRGLLIDDAEWERCLNEASSLQMPTQLRHLFSYICVFQQPSNALQLWNSFKEYLCEDYLKKYNSDVAYKLALSNISSILKLHGFSLNDFSLPTFETANITEMEQPELYINQDNTELNIIQKANEDQLKVINEVMKAIEENNTYKSNAFFIEGPGGTGKTFVYKCLINYCKIKNYGVIPVAWTGIAAMLLPLGRTVHSRFKLPLLLNETSVSSLNINSKEALEIKNAKIIIWDEAPMASSHALMAVNRLLKDITCNNEVPFGGKVIVLGGDFRQVLPVVPHASRHTIVQNSIKFSPLWPIFKIFNLTKNLRANKDEVDFASFLLQIGNGEYPTTKDECIEYINLPQDLIADKDIVSEIYGNYINTEEDYVKRLSMTAILAPKNEHCNEINEKVMSILPGKYKEYNSVNQLITEEAQEIMQYPSEFLNSLDLSGLPPHSLKLKCGAVVILLRNLNVTAGLLNGTRLIVKQMYNNCLDLEIITGQHVGQRILLPRIDLIPSDNTLPFSFRRRQFPIRLAFCITINKAQGQTMNHVGLYLPQPVFSHGQLYVALSRARSFKDVKVEIVPKSIKTLNVVFKEVL